MENWTFVLDVSLPVSPIQEYLKGYIEGEMQRVRVELENVRTYGTWPSGVKIGTPGELSQEIARLRKKLDEYALDLERLK